MNSRAPLLPVEVAISIHCRQEADNLQVSQIQPFVRRFKANSKLPSASKEGASASRCSGPTELDAKTGSPTKALGFSDPPDQERGFTQSNPGRNPQLRTPLGCGFRQAEVEKRF